MFLTTARYGYLVMKNGILLVLLLSLSLAAKSSWSCDELPEKITNIISENNDVILVGEYHGTKESPKHFYDIVCNSINISPKKIAVAIEFIHGEFELNGSNKALSKNIQKSNIWINQHDGKTSVAMFNLLKKLNILVGEQKINIVFFDSRENERDLAMAKILKEKSSEDTLVIALTGNRHNKLKHGNVWDPNSKNMGAYLVDMGVSTSSINLLVNGGSAWVCMPNCTTHELEKTNLDDKEEVFKASSKSSYQYHWQIGAVQSSEPEVSNL